jgi:predicted DNA-binding transcriptional regulator AlpA
MQTSKPANSISTEKPVSSLFYTAPQFLELLPISAPTFWRWQAKGCLPRSVGTKGRALYSRAVVDAYMDLVARGEVVLGAPFDFSALLPPKK